MTLNFSININIEDSSLKERFSTVLSDTTDWYVFGLPLQKKCFRLEIYQF